MKFRHLLPVLALCSPLAAMAVPAYPGLIKQTNPDGSTVEIRLHGDEFFSYATDAKGQWIMERDETGHWAVATRGGQQLAVNSENIKMLHDLEAGSFAREANSPKMAQLSEVDGRSKFPCTGSGNYLVVLLQYSDTKFSMENPQGYYTNWFNQEGFVDGDIKLSARDYYKKVSNGKFTPNFIVTPVITLPNSSKYYCGSNGKYSLFSAAINYALRQLVLDDFDFSRFDLDGDRVIDNIYFIYAGYGQADTGDNTCIWPHASSFSGTWGGLAGGRYACSNELRGSHYNQKDGTKAGIGTFCHEFGHVLGLPDMYDPNYDPACGQLVPGDWSIMCNGCYLGDGVLPSSYAAYDRWACRWMEYTQLEDGKTHTLAPLTTEAKAYQLKVPTNISKSEYFIFENRSKEDLDTYLPGNGILVWHVDYDWSIWNANRVNSTASHMRLTVMPPAGKAVGRANWPGTGAFDNLIATGMPNYFPTYNTPTSAFTPGIFQMKYDEDTKNASFVYQKTPITYSGEVVGSHGLKAEGDKTGFRLGWDALPDATGYIVSVQRRNSTGSLFYVDNYQDKLVTGTNYADVNESAAMMNQENRYTIRPVGPMMPSTKIYTSDWFKPSELTNVWGGVNSIADDDVVITVENGTINAPANARVFNMAGIETGRENLPAGIYIVRLTNKAVKVVVR